MEKNLKSTQMPWRCYWKVLTKKYMARVRKEKKRRYPGKTRKINEYGLHLLYFHDKLIKMGQYIP